MSKPFLTQSLHAARRQHPQRGATVFNGRRTSYEDFGSRVSCAANGLRQRGVGAGDRIGILSLNSDRYLEVFFAVWWSGGVVNPVNVRWSAHEIAYSLDDCGTSVLFVDERFAALVPELVQLSSCLKTIVYIGDSAAPPGMYGYEQLIAENQPCDDAQRGGDDLAGIFYTGGTTGLPKGVMLSHANLYGAAMSGLAEGLVDEGDVVLHVAPMFHLADGILGIMGFMRACTHVVVPRFATELVLAAIQDEGVTNTLLVPTMIQMLIDDPQLSRYRLGSLKRLLYGASAINEAVLERAIARLPGVEFVQLYGQTEMSPFVSVLKHERHVGPNNKLRSAGRPLVGIEAIIVDSDGLELPRNQVGEIATRGAGAMLGYWNKPEQTLAAMGSGWIRSGDGAYIDDDGFLFVVDRLKDMIVSGGENVYSAEVENAISRHSAVLACAVIGIPNERWGESVHAVVVIRPGVTAPSADDIRQHCQSLIAGYKCPRSVEFRDSLPLSGAGKVLKIELRAPYWRDATRRVA
ncbi:acyl-CoA synthetase [Hydrocarboniphaga sp.]|uniref:acyl-CoA synthetase n=1 Tax=Hydrocarboniphaga sp. TaxID=2033016 RepID=UPI003D1073F7